jgi:hypothetical protein
VQECGRFDICTVQKRKPIKMPQKDCFTDNLKATYPFLEEDQQAGKEL